MPLRKSHRLVPLAFATLALGAAVAPSPASAWSLFGSTDTATTSTSTSTSTTETTSSTTVAATTPVASVDATVATGCTPLDTRQAFLKHKDERQYYLAPGGSFETGGAAWTLSNGAKVVSGNENLGVQSGTKSLELPLGAVATSPAFCVDQSQPSFRFGARLSSLDGGYAAIVIYRNAEGDVTQTQFTSSSDGTYFNGNTTWNPSAISPLATKIPLASADATASVQLRFVGTTKSYGRWVSAKAYIDSVMVDPYRRG